jgi:hypothetical protein
VAVVMGNATVPSSNTVAAFTVPPGLSNVTIFNNNTAATNVYVGTSVKVSSSNGLVCHSLPTSFNAYPGSAGCTIYATTGGATASSLNYIISTGA